MAKPFFIVASDAWLHSDANRKRLQRGRVPLGHVSVPFAERCALFLRYRKADGSLITEQESTEASLHEGEFYVRSRLLCEAVSDAPSGATHLVLYFEGSKAFARCLAQWWSSDVFGELDSRFNLRLGAYDVPPEATTVVDAPSVVHAFRQQVVDVDPDLFALQAARFLDGPHVLERLLDHLMELRALEAPNFITVTKGLSDQLRSLLTDPQSPIQIRELKHSHLHLWSEMQGRPMAFVDGGVARLPGFPGIEQLAMRVGTYRVVPGDLDPTTRESWSMVSRVLADVVDPNQRGDEGPDRKRLQEAIRYTLEALVLMQSMEAAEPPSYAFLHGPLVNQFVTYDELEPYYLPDVLPEFLAQFGLSKEVITSTVEDIPRNIDREPMWNQFMAVYAVIIKRLIESNTPAVGVVERGVGRPVTTAVFDALKDSGLVQENFTKRFHGLLQHYGVSDDLLFGCILKQGEYLTPVSINKNPLNRAHDRWRPVVRQYTKPTATIVKPQDGTFPLRLELNASAGVRIDEVASVVYHTARLLPRYAFPVGLDIVDKFAKVPDWMSRAVNTAGAAALLRRTVEEADDPRVIAAVRRQLAGQPRDFFFRPTAN